MKKLLIIGLCLISIGVNGQNELSKNLNYLADSYDFIVDINPFDDNYIILGRSAHKVNQGFGASLFISRIDSIGNKIWETILSPSDDTSIYITSTKDMLLLPDKIVVLYGDGGNFTNKSFIISTITYDGALLETKKYEYQSNTGLIGNIIHYGNFFYFCLDRSKTEAELWKFDKNLEKIWTKTIYKEKNVTGFDLQVLEDSTIAFSFSEFGQFAGDHIYNLHIYDDEFNLQKSFKGLEAHDNHNIRTLQTSDGGYIAAWGKDMSHTLYDTFPYPTSIYKFDSLLNVEWEYVFIHRSAKQFDNFRKVGEHEFLGVGVADYFAVTNNDPAPWFSHEGWIFLISDEGELIWERHIFDSRYLGIAQIHDGIRTDDGYALVGMIDTVTQTNPIPCDDCDSWFLTLDENGCWNGNCNTYIIIDSDSTSHTIVGTEDIIQEESLKVFPNPSDGIFTIEHEMSGKNTLLVYDMTGNKILEQNLYAKKSIVNLQDLPTGMYIINVLNNKGQITKTEKIIIHK